MNASSLYVTVSRLVFQSDNNRTDLFRLLPYLRQSLSCTVCGELLRMPYSPINSPCQHHECKQCIGGRKNLKPSCSWCRDFKMYEENIQLRILLQCYKSLCEYIKLTPIYEDMRQQLHAGGNLYHHSGPLSNGQVVANGGQSSLVDIIDEGIRFRDDFKSSAGLTKATYSILPCLYTSAKPATASVNNSNVNNKSHQRSMPSSALKQHGMGVNNGGGGVGVIQPQSVQKIQSQLPQHPHGPYFNDNTSPLNNNNNSNNAITSTHINHPPSVTPTSMPAIKTLSNGSALYSVMYAGSGNRITIKRKPDSANSNANGLQQKVVTTNEDLAGTYQSQIANQMDHGQPQIQSSTPGATTSQTTFIKPTAMKTVAKPRKGCRCGNATLTPGKLTCCGQRCPCYVESKSCIDCKCRGCRNPHREGGVKVRPPLNDNYAFLLDLIDKDGQMVDDSSSSGGGGVSTMTLPLTQHPQQGEEIQQQQTTHSSLENGIIIDTNYTYTSTSEASNAATGELYQSQQVVYATHNLTQMPTTTTTTTFLMPPGGGNGGYLQLYCNDAAAAASTTVPQSSILPMHAVVMADDQDDDDDEEEEEDEEEQGVVMGHFQQEADDDDEDADDEEIEAEDGEHMLINAGTTSYQGIVTMNDRLVFDAFHASRNAT